MPVIFCLCWIWWWTKPSHHLSLCSLSMVTRNNHISLQFLLISSLKMAKTLPLHQPLHLLPVLRCPRSPRGASWHLHCCSMWDSHSVIPSFSNVHLTAIPNDQRKRKTYLVSVLNVQFLYWQTQGKVPKWRTWGRHFQESDLWGSAVRKILQRD